MSEKKLRTILKQLAGEVLFYEGDRDVYIPSEIMELAKAAHKALAEAGEPEMMQLLRWVSKQREKCRRNERSSMAYSWDKAIKFGYYAEAFKLVEKEIDHEFGYALEEEE